MHVVHVVNQVDRVCGYTRRTSEIIGAQRHAGLSPSIVCITEGQLTSTRLAQVIGLVSHATQLSEDRLYRAVHNNLIMAALMVDGLDHAMLRAPQPQLIHAHTPWPCAVAAYIIAREHDIPWLYEARGLQEETAVYNRMHPRESDWYTVWHSMESWVRLRAAHVLAISPALANDAHARGAQHVTVTPNAVDVDRFAFHRRAAAIRPVIGYIGSITPLEGVTSLVRNFEKIQQRLPYARCRIIGDGHGRPALEAEVHALNNKAITVEAAVPPSEVPALFRALDCVVIPRPDTLVTRTVTPLKPLEALASGTPVVSSDLPALRYVGEAGTIFYRPGSGLDMANAVVRAVQMRESLGQEGREWVVRERTWNRVVELQREAYDNLLRRGA